MNLVFMRFWLLRIMLSWTFTYQFLCGFMLSLLLHIQVGVQLLDHIVTVCFWETARLFPQHSYSKAEESNFLFILTNTCYFPFFWLVILVGVKWCEVVSHCGFDSWFSSDNSLCWAGFHVFTSHLYFFGEMSVEILPVFKLGCMSFYYCVKRVLLF